MKMDAAFQQINRIFSEKENAHLLAQTGLKKHRENFFWKDFDPENSKQVEELWEKSASLKTQLLQAEKEREQLEESLIQLSKILELAQNEFRQIRNDIELRKELNSTEWKRIVSPEKESWKNLSDSELIQQAKENESRLEWLKIEFPDRELNHTRCRETLLRIQADAAAHSSELEKLSLQLSEQKDERIHSQ